MNLLRYFLYDVRNNNNPSGDLNRDNKHLYLVLQLKMC